MPLACGFITAFECAAALNPEAAVLPADITNHQRRERKCNQTRNMECRASHACCPLDLHRSVTGICQLFPLFGPAASIQTLRCLRLCASTRWCLKSGTLILFQALQTSIVEPAAAQQLLSPPQLQRYKRPLLWPPPFLVIFQSG